MSPALRALADFEVDGMQPQHVWTPQSTDELMQMVARASEEGLAVIPWGGGTHISAGFPPRRYDVALSTAGLRQMIDHQQFDLTVTVQAGMTLAELDAVLEPAGQRLPCDPPHPERVTVGGMLAANAAGPLRHLYGTPRELVIGMRMAVSGGHPIHGGGRVVKNVTGYDLVRLFVGSAGTLGVIFEASFKVLPRPAVSRLECIPCRSLAECEGQLERLCGAEFALSRLELHWDRGVPRLYVGLEGDAEIVDWQMSRLPPLREDEDPGIGVWLRDFPIDVATDTILRVNLLSSDVCRYVENLPDGVQALGAAGVGMLRLFGNGLDAAAILRLREAAQTLGGTLVVERAPLPVKREVDVWGETGDGFALMQKIKETVDPTGVFSPGRFVGRL